MNGSQHMEAALVSDDASRFGTTVNPMLKELLDAWHPGAAPATESWKPVKDFSMNSQASGMAMTVISTDVLMRVPSSHSVLQRCRDQS